MQTAYVVNAQFIDNQTIHIDEPINLPNKNVLVTIQPIIEPTKKQKRVFGCAKGTIVIKDGFYEPIEDFKEYME